VLIVGHEVVRHILDADPLGVLDIVRDAYVRHAAGDSRLPHSVFLRCPGGTDRIIGLPAYLGGAAPAAGMKWIASFPGNLRAGLERASAVVVLNDPATGRPTAVLEGSVISARRTAASAAVAAELLAGPTDGISLVGCGLINREVLRAVRLGSPGLRRVTLHDLEPARAVELAGSVTGLDVRIAPTAEDAVAANTLTSIATTASRPHLDLAACPPGTTVLHLSLRDLTPGAILRAQNVVDDTDHVCRERTSLHLAELATGHRGFVDGQLGDLLRGTQTLRRDPSRPLVFSPFGLGVLDLAVAEHVRATAQALGLGTRIDGFLPGTVLTHSRRNP
jgi:ornithine cyclodeaminase